MSVREPFAQARDGNALWDDARRLLAYGGHHRMLLRSLYRGEETVFPRFAVRAHGCEITDETGRTYVDWSSAWGPAILGYGHPAVEEAISAQFEAGPTLPLIHPVELDVARALTEMVPCAQMVAFGKNGSDVVTAAVRVARAATGRDVILQCGFHGFHDWYMCRFDNVAGIPRVLRDYVEPFPYNDLPALEALFERFRDRVAAVVMEPVTLQMPADGYLEAVRNLAHDNGALLVFDEMVTAFRLAPGGAQEVFGVEPDIACLGKSIANGMPLSAVVGARAHMRHLPHVAYGMTFRGETLSLAAARATLEVIRDQAVPDHLAATGGRVRAAFAELCAERGLHCHLAGPHARMTVVFEPQGEVRADRLQNLFVQECASRGLLTNGTLMPSLAHDDAAVGWSLDAFAGALDAVADMVHGRAGAVSPDEARTLVARGFVDGLAETDDGLVVAGWLLVDDTCVETVELVSPAADVVPAEPVDRAGVAESYPDIPGAEHAGYRALLPEERFKVDGVWEFEIHAYRGGALVFTCAVGLRSRADGSAPALQPPYDVSDGLIYV